MKPEGAIAHFGFHVENFDEIMKTCESLGVTIHYDGPVKFEKSRSIYISDPNGYDIELSEVFGGGL
jgi:catechol 2,3-dioxygenase-like lactoylglutathione lyase family enzyme